jgi:hypothetical protein
MNNAERIVATIDRHLPGKSEIVVFGSAALMLDRRYAEHLAARVTHDVDIIIPSDRELQMESDQNFWHAIDATNKELEPEGLYVTHIFPEREVTLTPEWKDHAVRLETPAFKHLGITRPRVLDLIISKMGRGDAQDLEDVRMMLQLDHRVWGRTITTAELTEAATRAHVPSVYQEIFPRARSRVIATVKEIERVLNPSGS